MLGTGRRRAASAATLAGVLTLVLATVPLVREPVTAQAAPPFSVGAAVAAYAPYCGPDGTPSKQNCTPPPAGFADPADCVAPPGFTGPRRFAFEEPYIDSNGSGHYDLGDPFVDCNADGRWDGNFIGGGSNAPRYYDYIADPPGARAMVVGNGTRTIAVEVLDHEGAFDVFLEAIRTQVGTLLASLPGPKPCAGLNPADVYISSTHDESAPDSIGLYGVTAVTSSSNPYWVSFLESRAASAVIQACESMRPATIRYGQAIEPAGFRQCYSSYPFVDDQLVPTLEAVDPATGRAIVTIADVSQHTETLGFNGGTAADPGAPTATTLDQEKQWLSADWPVWLRSKLETDLGGVGIEMAGSVGSNETPQIFPAPVSRTPQQFVDASHPAGCRTTFTAAQSTMVPLGYYSESRALGQQLASAVESALMAGGDSMTTDIQGQRVNACVQVTNALFDVAGIAGVFGARPGYADPACTVPLPPPPSGNAVATFINTQVAGFRIGDGTFVSLPGEVFPFTYLRSFLGPQDMPCPDPNSNGDCGGTPNPTVACASGNPYALPPWLMPHMHTTYRFIDGLAEDMIGYIFPCGNGVGVPGEYPVSNPAADSTDRFGCGHSDDSESASSSTGGIVGDAAVVALDHLGGTTQAPEDIETGRYVLPGGVLSRDPLGTPESIGCRAAPAGASPNTLFAAQGPANAVELKDGTLITPAAWMDLSGRGQAVPDRNTRGWIDAQGTRHWLDVFADLTLTPPASPGVNGGAPGAVAGMPGTVRSTPRNDGAGVALAAGVLLLAGTRAARRRPQTRYRRPETGDPHRGLVART